MTPLIAALFGGPQQRSLLEDDPVERLRQSLPERPMPPGATAELTMPSPAGMDPLLPRDQWLGSTPTTAGMLGNFQQAVDRATMFGTADLAVGGGGALGRVLRKPSAATQRKPSAATQRKLAREAAQAEAQVPFRTAPLEPTPGLPPLSELPQATPDMDLGPQAAHRAGRQAEASGNLLFDYSMLGRNPAPGIAQRPLPRPGTGAVSERVQAILDNPDIRRQMLEHVRAGQQMGAGNWYDIQPLRQEFQKLLGPEEGDRRFRLFVDMIAGTSPQSNIDLNVRNASYRYAEALRQGGDLRAAGLLGKTDPIQPPPRYGHFAQKLHARNAQAIAQGGLNMMDNPKPSSFSQNILGNEVPVTVDNHAVTLPAILSRDPRWLETSYKSAEGGPTISPRQLVESGQVSMDEAVRHPAWWAGQPDAKTEYAALERLWQEVAQEAGLSPRAAQAAGWVGGGKVTGLQSRPEVLLRILDDHMQMTAQARGQTPRQVLEDFVQRGVPFWSALGVLGGTAALQPGAAEAGTLPPSRAAQAPGGALARLLAGLQQP